LAIGTSLLLLSGSGNGAAFFEWGSADGFGDVAAVADLDAVAEWELLERAPEGLLGEGVVGPLVPKAEDGTAAVRPASSCNPTASATPPPTAMTAPTAIAAAPHLRDRRRDARVCMQSPQLVDTVRIRPTPTYLDYEQSCPRFAAQPRSPTAGGHHLCPVIRDEQVNPSRGGHPRKPLPDPGIRQVLDLEVA